MKESCTRNLKPQQRTLPSSLISAALWLLFIAAPLFAGAQCGSCTSTITSNIPVTVGSGQTVCLNYSGFYTQTVTINGTGTLCISASTSFNGNLNISAAGNIYNSGSFYTSFTISNGLSFTNNSGASLIGNVTIGSGTLTNNGTMNNNITLNSGGTLNNNNSSSANITMNAGSTFNNSSNYSGNLTNNGGNITNSGTISNGFTLNGTLNNSGTLNNGVTINNGASMTNNGNVNGNIVLNSGGTLNNNHALSANINMSGGTFNNSSAYSGTLSQNGGTVVNSAGGSMTGNNGLNGGTFSNYGSYTGGLVLQGTAFTNYSGGNLHPSSVTLNSGSITNNAGGTMTMPAVTVNNVTLTNNGTASFSNITINGGGTVSLNGTQTISGSVNNNGSFSLSGPGTIGGSFTQNSGATTNFSGGITISGNASNNGTINLSGNLNITGSYSDNAGATIKAVSGGSSCTQVSIGGTNTGGGTFNGNGLGMSVGTPPSPLTRLTGGASSTASAPSQQGSGLSLSVSNFTVTGSFTSPTASITGYLVLRYIGSSAPSDNPTNNISYSVGTVVGSSVVAAVINSGATGTRTFTDALPHTSCGQTVYYRIFSFNGSVPCEFFDLTGPLTGNYAMTAGTITPYLNASSGGGWLSVSSASVCSGGWVEFGSQSSVSGTGGIWTISGPNSFYSYSRDTTLNNLQAVNAGTYVQTYYHANGCTVSQNFSISIATASASVTNATVCPGSPATITASGAVSYVWNTGASTASITVSPASTTTYTVTATGANGCTVSANGTVTINTPAASATSVSVCAGSSGTITASGGTSYVWSTGATTASITASPASTTTYMVTVTSATGCTATASGTITILNPGTITPYLNASSGGGWLSVSAASVCQGGWIEFGPQSSAGGGNWTISGPNSFYSYSRDTTLNNLLPINSGTYVATFYNPNGCTVSQNFSITVNATPVSTVSATTHCTGTPDTLTANGGGTYAWSTGATTVAISTTTAGTYRVTVTSAAGCTVTASGSAAFNTAPTAAIAVTSACSGGTSTLTASGGGSYTWNTGATTALINSSATTTYTVTVSNAGGCTATASAASSFYTTTVTAASNTPVCTGDVISLFATPTGGSSYTYTWSGPAAFAAATQNASLSGVDTPNSGTYTISITDNHGCTASASTSVYVNPNCLDSTTVGVNGGSSSDAPCTQILRFDHYSTALASRAAGQNHQWILKDGNILSMNIRCTAGGFTTVTAPSWSGSAFGQTGYSGLSGRTVLYTLAGGYSKLVFSNIQVHDSLGHLIPNFTLIGIDGESTDNSERDTINSNGSTWFDYDTINPPAPVGSIPSETGIGTGFLVWTGTGPANARARLVSTNNPGTFTFSTVAGGLQGFAMGLSNPVEAALRDTICSNSAFHNTPTNLPAGTTYTWPAPVISPAGSITGATAQSTPAASVSQTLVNHTNAIATATYTVLPSNNCSGLGFTFTVVVYPPATATVTPSAPQCAGNAVTVTATPNPAGSYTYSWSGPSSFTATGASFTIASSTLSNAGTYTVTMTDAHSCTSTASGLLSVANCLSVNGFIFNDANGNGLIDGTDTKTSLGQALYSVLSDTSGHVVSTSPIAANGAFTVGQALPNTSGYTISVSTANPTVGALNPGYSWPSGWAGTKAQYGSSNLYGPGVYSAGNENVPIAFGAANISNMLIGFDRLPTTTSQSYTIPYPTLNAQKALLPANGLGIFAGSDPEDGSYGAGGTFTITSLAGMNGNSLYYDADGDGILEPYNQITGYTVITNFVPSRLYVKFTGHASLSATFGYAAIDAAGQTNLTPSTYTIMWASALPVQMLYFTAEKATGTQALLKWATASESDNDHWEIQRSADAEAWTSLGTVKGAGSTETENSYAYTDRQPLDGSNYYRLKQVDADGNYHYSDIQELNFAAADASLSIFPNPLGGAATLNILSGNGTGINRIQLFNATGQTAFDQTFAAGPSVSIGNLQLPAGLYVLVVYRDGLAPAESKLLLR